MNERIETATILRASILTLAMTLAAGAGVAGAGVAAAQPVAAGGSAEARQHVSRGESGPSTALVAAVTSVVAANFLRPVSSERLARAAIEGMLRDIDPYARYLDEQEWDAFNRQVAGTFAGIGVQLEVDASTHRPRIAHLMLGSLAATAGAEVGDCIYEIEGQSTEDMSLARAVALIQGVPGSLAHLMVRHPLTGGTAPLTIERHLLRVPSIRGIRRDAAGREDYVLDRQRGVGYLRIMQWAEDAVDGVSAALVSLEADHVRGLLIDLREDPGGLQSAAVAAADLFLGAGRILTVHHRQGGDERLDAHPGTLSNVPVVLLVNANTESASEIFAAALQDHGRAVVVGQRTFGKGYAQTPFPLGKGQGGLLLTTESFQRPSGKTIDRHDAPAESATWGVVPDPGMELIVEGPEYTAWLADFLFRDLPIAPAPNTPAGDTAPAIPDRVLDRGLELLEGMIPVAAAGPGAPAARAPRRRPAGPSAPPHRRGPGAAARGYARGSTTTAVP